MGLIFFINDSITTAFLNTLRTSDSPDPSTIQGIDVQLEINETMTLAEFNARVTADPNYPTVIHLNNLRILVILSDFTDQTNRQLADIVIYAKGGLANILKNNVGPPGLSLPIERINIWNLVNGLKGNNTACAPFPGFLAPPENQTPWNPKPHEHMKKHFPEGMGSLELWGVEAMEFQHGAKKSVFGDGTDNDEENDDE